MKGTILVKERYEVKSTFFGDDYIDTKDGPAYIRHSLFGDDYIDTKDGPAFRKHSLFGDDYFEMPKKKDSGSKAAYNPPSSSSSSYSSSTTPRYTSKYNSSSNLDKRPLIPLSSAIFLFIFLIISAWFSIPETALAIIGILINLIIIFIPREPILSGFLYRFFTATIIYGAIDVWGLVGGVLKLNILIGAIAAIVFFIIFKLILAYKMGDS